MKRPLTPIQIFARTSLRGVTLLELLIVLAVIGTMSAVVLASYGNGRADRQVEAASGEVEGMLREAQNYALAGKQFGANTVPCAFQVDWSSGSATYTLGYYYNTNSDTTCSSVTTIESKTLANGVLFSNTSNVRFTVPHADPSGAVRKAEMNKGSVTRSVCIYSSADGRIENVSGRNCP